MNIQMFKLFCLLLCGVIFAPLTADSFPYQPAGTIRIMSESAAGVEESPKAEGSIWRVVPEVSLADSTLNLLFYKEMSDNQVCKLVISRSGTIHEADITGVNGNMMIRADGLLLVPGFPVPCDILPIARMAGEKIDDHSSATQIVNVKRSTSTQTFVDTLEIQTYPVTWQTAQSNGWLAEDTLNTDSTGLLQVIQVVNQGTGELLALQLWAADTNWWIYEKTRFRQSWLLP